MLSVSFLELFWIAVNLSAVVITVLSLFDAISDRKAVRQLNGAAREIAANAIVRREVIRLAVQGLLLSLVIPGLFSDREVPLSFGVVVLISVSVLIAVQTYLDARERKALTATVAADVILSTDKWGAEIADLVRENTAVSQKAVEAAEAAYTEANHVNQKIASQQEAGLAQGKQRRAVEAEAMATIDKTAEQVAELHSGEAPT